MHTLADHLSLSDILIKHRGLHWPPPQSKDFYGSLDFRKLTRLEVLLDHVALTTKRLQFWFDVVCCGPIRDRDARPKPTL